MSLGGLSGVSLEITAKGEAVIDCSLRDAILEITAEMLLCIA